MDKPSYEELEAQLAKASADLEAKTPTTVAEVEEPALNGEIVPDAGSGITVAPSSAEVDVPKSLPEGWPTKGYTGAQPWEVEEPPALGHGHGLLIVGSDGEEVRSLCAFLAYAGYPTDVSEGKNPLCIFDESVKTAVGAFRRDYGVEEDPAIISASTPDVAGPWTWAALYRIARRQKA